MDSSPENIYTTALKHMERTPTSLFLGKSSQNNNDLSLHNPQGGANNNNNNKTDNKTY
jgi:hypothetical protein